MGIHDPLADSQAQAGAADIVGPLYTVEFIKYAGQIFLWDPTPRSPQ